MEKFKDYSPFRYEGNLLDFSDLNLFSFGSCWYVDGDNGNDNWDGESKDTAFKTIQAAIDVAGDNTNDTIYVLPIAGDYAENLIVTKSCLTIRDAGLKGNSWMSTIAPASGIALTLNQVERFTAIGLRFAGTSGVGGLSDSEGSLFVDCDFYSDTTDGFKFLSATDTSYTGSGTQFVRCMFRNCGAVGLKVYKGTGTCLGLQATNVNVWDCQFYGNTGADIADDSGSTTPTYFNDWDISGCKFMTVDKTTYLDMDGGVGTRCMISGNWFADNTAQTYMTSTMIKLPSGGSFIANYHAKGITSGVT